MANTSPYFTLSKAQQLVSTNANLLSPQQLQKHIVRLRDYMRYVDTPDMQRLIAGNYYVRLIDWSATGLVPKDPWLRTNLGQALDEATMIRGGKQ